MDRAEAVFGQLRWLRVIWVACVLLPCVCLAQTQETPTIAPSEPSKIFVPDKLPDAEPAPVLRSEPSEPASSPTLPASSPSNTPSELQLFELEEQVSQYAAKIVTASKTEEELGESPATVTVLTHEDITRLGVTTLEELLNYVPGFQVTRDVEQGTAFRIGVRGRSKFNSEYVLVLLNGQRLNDIYTGGITLLNRYVTVDNIKQIEVIRGPGSALYGSGAFLGVINIVTFRVDENRIAVQYGTQNAISARVSLSKEIGPVEIYGFARYYSDQGYQYNQLQDLYGITGTSRDPIRTFDFLGSLRWKGLSLHIRHSEHQVEDFLGFGVLQNQSGVDWQRQTSIGISYEHKIHRLVTLSTSAGFLLDRWKGIYKAIPEGAQLSDGTIFSKTVSTGPIVDSFQLSLNTNLKITPISSNEIVFGVGYDHLNQYNVVNLTNQNPVTGEFFGSIQEFTGEYNFNELRQRNIGSFFVQDKQKIGKWVQLTGGIRLDYYDDFGLAYSPRFAAVFTTPIRSAFKFIYGKAFRAPSFLEFYDKNNSVDFGNVNLKPEDIHTFEVSAAQDHKYFYIAANYFHNMIMNLVDYGPPVQDPRNPYNAPTFINNQETKNSDGLEFDVTIKPLQHPNHSLFLRGTLTYLFNADDLPMPGLFGSFQVNYRVWKLMFDLNGVARQSYARLPEQGTYVVLNANVIVEITKKLQLQLLGRNLLNQEYRTLSLPLGTSGVPNRGITFLAGVQVKL